MASSCSGPRPRQGGDLILHDRQRDGLEARILISLISALVQGAMAIALVAVAYLALRGTGITMTKATWAMEVASFAMVAVFGGWLLARKVYELWPRRSSLPIFANASAGSRPDWPAFSRRSRWTTTTTILRPAATRRLRRASYSRSGSIEEPGFRPAGSLVRHHRRGPAPLLPGHPGHELLDPERALYRRSALGSCHVAGTAITVSILALVAVTAKDVAVRLADPAPSPRIAFQPD